MAELGRATVVVAAATASADQGIERVDRGLRGLGTAAKAAKAAVVAFAAAFTTAAVKDFFKSAIEEGVKAEDSYRRLGTAVTNAGGNFKGMKSSLDATVDAVQKLSNQTDDDLRNALTKLISTTGDVSGSMKNLGLVADVAAERTISLDDAAVLVGKTMNGNTTPIMRAFGVQVKDAAEGVAFLHTKTDGFGKLATQGFGGALKNLTNQWGELKEAVGLAIIGSDDLSGSTGRLADALVGLQQWVKANEGNIGAFIDKVISLGGAVASVGKFLVTYTPNWLSAGKAVGVFGEANTATAKQVEQGNQAVSEATKLLGGAFRTTQGEMTKTVLTQGVKRVTLTAEELKAQEAARAKAAAEREKGAKDAAKRLEALEDLANKSSLDLLGANHRAWLEVEQKFRKDMEGLSVEQQKKAEALLKQTHGNQLLAWAGFTEKADAIVPTVWRTMRDEIGLTIPPTKDLNQVLKDHGDVLSEDDRKTLESKAGREAFRQGILDTSAAFVDGVGKLEAFAQAAGIHSPELEAFATGISNIGEGIGRIAAGDILGGITSGIAGVKGIADLFTGESESSRRTRLALEATQRELERHRATLGDLIEISAPGRQVADIQSILATILKDPRAALLGTHARGGEELTADLKRQLLRAGISWEDFSAIAKQAGVADLREGSSGFGGQLKGLAANLGALDAGFPATFAGQLEKLKATASITGAGASSQLNDLLGLLESSVGSPALAAALQGINPDTPEGRGGVLQALADLLNSSPSAGGLGDLNLAQFRSTIQMLADLIQGMGSFVLPLGLGGPVPQLPRPPLPAGLFENVVPSLDLAPSWAPWASGAGPAGYGGGGGREVTVTIEAINVSLEAGSTGTQIAEELAAALDQEFAKRFQLNQMGIGSADRT